MPKTYSEIEKQAAVEEHLTLSAVVIAEQRRVIESLQTREGLTAAVAFAVGACFTFVVFVVARALVY